jgi:hypothetical protein
MATDPQGRLGGWGTLQAFADRSCNYAVLQTTTASQRTVLPLHAVHAVHALRYAQSGNGLIKGRESRVRVHRHPVERAIGT